MNRYREGMESRDRYPLARLLSRLGVASRAEAGRWVREGRVRVHGCVVRDPERSFGLKDPVEVQRDGVWRPAEAPAQRRYAAFHKPPGVLVSARSEAGHAALTDALPPELAGCFAVGRLDLESEGLLLLTDDGPWADAVIAPGRFEKRYRVTFDAEPTDAQIAAMAAGGALERGIVVEACRVERAGPCACRFFLHEGRNRQIRRLAKREGLKVRRLVREAIGPVELGALEPGAWRWLDAAEARNLSGLPDLYGMSHH
ncbi:MAG TPA: pseudouridine synthase [Holophagaceae bacterium]|nr:pseudouridine synthase [Holophagaceae bacterium]